MTDRQDIETAAAGVYSVVYRGDWGSASDSQKTDCRVYARTIVSAKLCRQSAELAAKRLATWHWVDKGVPHVAWDDAPQELKNRLLRIA